MDLHNVGILSTMETPLTAFLPPENEASCSLLSVSSQVVPTEEGRYAKLVLGLGQTLGILSPWSLPLAQDCPVLWETAA